ncbi:MAG TPA: VWA domain-containing protein [Roseiflexaceae bacterium]|nr:VWA domain-containing protein [Roseiflexaceae bacterium]
MSLLWPGYLLLLGALPLLVAAYLWVLRRRRRFTVRYSSLSLVREAVPRSSRLRRHLPFALLLLAVAALVVAGGRPVAALAVPSGQATIVLALDVSRSMRADDIAPSRIAAAKAAALSFIEHQVAQRRIGLVAFAGFAEMIQTPTNDQEALEDAIGGLTLGRGTAIGSGILEALDVIAANGAVDAGGAPGRAPDGATPPAVIVLLTDGVSTTGPPPLEAAQQAAARNIPIYTIGFGTENGGGQPSGRDGQGSGRFRRGIDEATLRQIAELTGGAYFAAESAGELQRVFADLPTSLTTRIETTEISVVFAALGALLAALAIGLSLRWNPVL